MKSIFVILLTTILTNSVFISSAQNKAAIISFIKKEFRLINADSSYKVKVLDNEETMHEGSDGGSQLTGYYKNGKIRKIVDWVGISYGVHITEYYFKNEELIFIYKTFNAFALDNKTQSLLYDSLAKTFEGRYYFYKNNKISFSEKGTDPFRDQFDIVADPALPQVQAMRLKQILAKK
jgi:hypothetical protein